ncbi:hypothetical protein [Aeromicrobium wangtongii]|uniref:Secreted protein n=1 Tax=Aeromicrobium wangtongii TaxID=2969247 RepID=A0ABY5M366_9ACTN|nr:hypothetical protein [Aeromicrobium wangtongii]MCD9198257.1 hypothetical protein [Aeromicrobium wangtongii]UUP12292.1 hypothetical protein NQV15_10530 [Aeromicrobium wangtongii]
MLFTRAAARRSAAVLMMALVAMLLVATGGSARATQSRTSVGTGHASAAPHSGRQVALVPQLAHDPVATHLDLATTPPPDPAAPGEAEHSLPPEATSSLVPADAVSPVGRAPPTV